MPNPLAYTADPVDRYAPENALVELIDNALRSGVNLGLGVQIKSRIAGIAELAPDAATPPAGSSAVALPVNARLVLASAVAALAGHAKRSRTAQGRKQHEALAAGLAALMSGLTTEKKNHE